MTSSPFTQYIILYESSWCGRSEAIAFAVVNVPSLLWCLCVNSHSSDYIGLLDIPLILKNCPLLPHFHVRLKRLTYPIPSLPVSFASTSVLLFLPCYFPSYRAVLVYVRLTHPVLSLSTMSVRSVFHFPSHILYYFWTGYLGVVSGSVSFLNAVSYPVMHIVPIAILE